MRRALWMAWGLLLSSTWAGCWVGPSDCLLALFDCDRGQSCVAGRCVASATDGGTSGGCQQSGAALVGPTGSSSFGAALALESSLLAVGDPTRGSMHDGAVDIFSPLTTLAQTLTSPTPLSSGHFGRALAVGSPKLWVGEPEDSATIGLGKVYQLTRTPPASSFGAATVWMSSGVASLGLGANLAFDGHLLAGVLGDRSFFDDSSGGCGGGAATFACPQLKTTPMVAAGFGSRVAIAGAAEAIAAVRTATPATDGLVFVAAAGSTSVGDSNVLAAPGGTRFAIAGPSGSAPPVLAIAGQELLVAVDPQTGGHQLWSYSVANPLAPTVGSAINLQLSAPIGALAASGSLAVVGTPSNGSGRAWVLRKVGDSWQAVELQPSAAAAGLSQFGAALAVSGSMIAVGAPGGSSGGQVILFDCSQL